MSGERLGYIRVSTLDQSTKRQDTNFEGLRLDKVFTDMVSGKNTNRPQLNALLHYARTGDTVYVHSMDRLARNLDDLRKIVKELTEKKIVVQFIKEGLTFSGDDSPMANLMLSVMGAFAEFERALIKERQMEGIAIAKAAGLYKGRKRSMTDARIQELRQRVQNGDKKTTIAREMGISRETLYKYL